MIVTVGSINMDLVVEVQHHPEVGETVIGSDVEMHSGGKGANQAVAAARLGSPVRMVGALGNDSFGKQLLEGLKEEGVEVGWVKVLDHPSGAAFISVDKSGQNRIIVSPGTNARLLAADIVEEAFMNATVVMLQLEIPLETVREAARRGKQVGATVILNAAPVCALSSGDYKDIDVLVVNEIEAGMLLGRERARSPQEALSLAGELTSLVPHVIITLGNKGVVWKGIRGEGQLQALKVTVVDTTAAGDAFVGALAAGLSTRQDLEEAMALANAAGALAVTKPGAQPSLPTRHELQAFLMEVRP